MPSPRSVLSRVGTYQISCSLSIRKRGYVLRLTFFLTRTCKQQDTAFAKKTLLVELQIWLPRSNPTMSPLQQQLVALGMPYDIEHPDSLDRSFVPNLL